MHRLLLILSICLLAGTALQGQNPGYKGRHFSITAESYLSPSFTFPNINKEKGLTALNHRFGVRLGYALSEEEGLNVSYNYYPTKLKLIRQPTNSGQIKGYGDLTGHNIGLHYRASLNEIFHPLGDYVQVGGSLYTFQVNYDKSDFRYQSVSTNQVAYSLPEKETHQFKKWGFNMAFGTERILFDYLFIDYAVQMNIIIANGFIGGNYCCGDHPVQITEPKKYLRRAASNRVLAHHFINLKLGIGYLAF